MQACTLLEFRSSDRKQCRTVNVVKSFLRTRRDEGVQGTLLPGGALEDILLVGAAGNEAVHPYLLVLPDAVAPRHRLQVVLHIGHQTVQLSNVLTVPQSLSAPIQL